MHNRADLTDTLVSPSRAKGRALSSFGRCVVLPEAVSVKEPIDRDMLELAFRVLVEAAHPDVADALTVQGILLNLICQKEICDP